MLSLALFGFSIVSCLKKAVKTQPSTLDFAQFPLKNLSEYGFYDGDMAAMKPAEGLLPYEPIATLFTDYAFKKRFVWMPEGQSAAFDYNKPNASLDFQEKTILVKNFYYPADFRKPEAERRIIETRLLVKKDGKWEAYPYLWNQEQTDAKYKVTGGIYDVSWVDEQGEKRSIKYAMPNKNQCKSCHYQDGVFTPIGPKLKQLNHEIVYDDHKANQLSEWTKVGYLKTMPEQAKIKSLVAMDDPKAPLGDRARSYLDVNCGHCHSDGAPAGSSGLRLNYEVEDPYHWGVKKSPVAAGIGAGDFKYDIYPGHGEESIMTYRMNATNPGIMMPEIGRVSVHKEGVALIKEWIDGLVEE